MNIIKLTKNDIIENGSNKIKLTPANVTYDYNDINIQRYKDYKSVGLDTIDNDLSSLSKNIRNAYTGWQTQDTMKKTKSSIESMYNRLLSVKEFRNTYGITEGDEAFNNTLNLYKSTLDGWDELTSYYGGFADADAYKRGQEEAKRIAEENEKAKIDDLDAVRAEIADMEEQYDYWKKSADFFEDKGFTWTIPNSTEWQNLNESINPQEFLKNNNKFEKTKKEESQSKYAGYTLEELANAIEEKKKYLEKATKIQEDIKYSEMAKSGKGKKGYEEWLAFKEAQKESKAKKEAEQPVPQWLVDAIGNMNGQQGDFGDLITDTIELKQEDNSYQEPKSNWTEEELYEFGARWNENNPKIAFDYAANLNNAKATEALNRQKEKAREFATRNVGTGAVATVGSIFSNMSGWVDVIDDATDKAAGRSVLVEEPRLTPFEWGQASQSAISEKLNEYGTLDEDIAILGGKGWGDVYGLGTSIVQSAITTKVGGPVLTAITYFGSAAASAVDDATARGATMDEALLYGTIVGAAEAVSEYIGADKLLSIGKKELTNAFVEILKQAGAEGLEEMFSATIENIADDIVMGENSKFNQLVKQYKLQGLSDEEAVNKAWSETVEDIAYNGLSGAVSGGIHAGPVAGVNAMSHNIIGKYYYGQSNDSMYALVNNGLAMPQDSTAYNLAVKADARLKNGKSLSGTTLYNLADAIKSEIETKSKSRFQELGVDKKTTKALSPIVAKAVFGENLTQQEQETLNSYEIAAQVVEEMSADKTNTIWKDAIKISNINNDTADNNVVTDKGEVLQSSADGEINGSGDEYFGDSLGDDVTHGDTSAVGEAIDGENSNDLQLSEPALKDIARAPTAEEAIEEAITGKQKTNIQRHIVDICKKLDSNVTVEFVNKLEGNGKFIRSQNKILIKSDLNAVQMYVEVFKHEFMHRLETKALYSKFFNYCFKKSKAFEQYVRAELKSAGVDFNVDTATRDGALEAYTKYKFNQYKNSRDIPKTDSEAFTMENAQEEIIADFFAQILFQGKKYRARIIEALENADGEALIGIGDEVSSEAALLELQQKEPTLFEQVLEWFKDVINRLRGMPQANSLVEQLDNELDYLESMARRAYLSKDSKRLIRKKQNEIKCKIMSFDDGVKYVDITTDQERFEGLTTDEMQKEAKRVIKENFVGKVIGVNNRVFVNSRSAGEYSYPSKFIKNSDITEAKMRASTELDNLVEIGSNHRNKPDGLYGHIHAKAVGGFDYYDTIFKVGNKYYFGIINIMITDRGRLLKDITQIRDISNDIIAQYGENPQGEFVENVSEKSISDFDKNVNSKDSKRLMKKKFNESKYSFSAEKQREPDTLRTLHAAVNVDKNTNANVKLSINNLSQKSHFVNIEEDTSSFKLNEPDIENIEISDEVEFLVGLNGFKLNKVQKHIVDICKKLDSEIAVEFVDKLEGNGKFIRNQNKILIKSNLNAVQMYVEVFKHEFMHRLETKRLYSKFFNFCFKKSKAFEQYVRAEVKLIDNNNVDDMARESVLNLYTEYKYNQYINDKNIPSEDRDAFTMENVQEEIIADFFAQILFQGKKYRARIIEALENADGEALIGIGDEVNSEAALLELQQKEPTLFEQVVQWLRDIINRLRGMPQANSLVEQLDNELDYLESMARRAYLSKDSKRLIREKQNEVRYLTSEDADLYKYIKDALAGKLSKKSYYKLSNEISDRMADDIEKIVGFSVRGYGNEISPGNISHIEKEHGINGRSDQSMNDHHDLARIAYIVENYEKIKEGKISTEYKNSDGTFAKTVVLQKKINDSFYYVVEAVPDAKIKSLHITSAYINKKDTFSDVLVSEDPKRYVQDEHQPNVSSNSITHTTRKVKETSETYRSKDSKRLIRKKQNEIKCKIMPFDYIEELLSNPDNYELEIVRRQPARSATGEKHPNTSSELPSSDIIFDDLDNVNNNDSTKTDAFNELEQEKQNNEDIRFVLNKKVAQSMIDDNVVKVVTMNSVADLTGEEFKKGAVDLITQVEEYFNSIGNIVKSKYGDVELTRVGIKSSLGHGIGRKKAAAFKAVPNTIKYGEIINYQKNWKNRGYDTAIFAAPITINGKRHFLAVVINVEIDKNSYYLHEVALQEVESNTSFKTGTVKNGTPGDALPSIYNLLQKLQVVNNNYSTNADMFKGLGELNVREKAEIESVCNELGRKVVFEDLRDMVYNGETISPDGYIDADNLIHINTYAENPLGFVFKHELTHYAEKSDGYDAFVNAVKNSSIYAEWIKSKTGKEYYWDAEDTYRQMVYNSQSKFNSINDTRIDNEIIADFVGEMLFTDNGSGLLAIAVESAPKQRNVIVQWVLKFIAYIKRTLGIGKSNFGLEISVLEDSFKCLLNDSVSNGEQQYTDDIQFCFVRCTDKQKIAAAEQMEKQGAKQYKIWDELKIIRNGWGDWLSEVNTYHFSFFAKGTASVEKGRSNPNVRIEENIVEGKLGDFVGFKSLFNIYPQLKKVKVVIKYAATDYDTAKYLIDSNKLLINKKLYDAFVTKNDQTIKMHLVRELQRMIQVVEGRVIDSNLKNIERLRVLGFPESRTEDRQLTENEIRNSFADEYEARVAERRQRARNSIFHNFRKNLNYLNNQVLYEPYFNYDDILLFDDNDKLITAKEYDVINENHRLDAYPSMVYDTKRDVTSLVSGADYVDVYPITPQDERRLIEQATTQNSEKMPYYLTDLFYKKKTKRKKVDNRIRAGNSGCLENNGDGKNKFETVKSTLYHNAMIEASGSDTAGRALSSLLTRQLNNNAFKDSNGNILSFYLWNNKPAKIERFVKLGKTFTTFDNVLDEFFESKNIEPFRYNGMFQEFYIDSVCPLVLEMSEWNTAAVAELLLKSGEISKNYYDELLKSKTAKKSEFNNASARSLTERIKLLGYDSVVLVGDSGCNVMVFDASQVIPVAQKGIVCNSEINQLQEDVKNEKEISSVKFLTINEEGKNSININEIKNNLSNCNDNTEKLSKLTEILTGVGNIEHPVLQQARVGSSGVLENTGGKRLEIYSKYKLLKTRGTLPVSDYDTAGREVNPQIKLKNSNTIFKDNDGRLLSLFAFKGRFSHEGIGFQLGTLKSARDIYKDQKARHPKLIDYQYQEYYVNMCNPYVWYRSASNTTPAKIANSLFAEGKITFDEYSRLLATEGAKTTSPKSSAALYLKSTLLRHGYDGVICMDNTYDIGSITVFALKPEQLTPVTVNGDSVENINVEKNKKVFIDYIDNKEYNKKKKKYLNRRPSYGKNQLLAVWNFAKKLGGGKVIDPTGKEIVWDTSKARNGQWDMGHIPGQKYSEMHKKYLNDEITEEEFVNWYRDPKNYRPELPSTNRSHKYE